MSANASDHTGSVTIVWLWSQSCGNGDSVQVLLSLPASSMAVSALPSGARSQVLGDGLGTSPHCRQQTYYHVTSTRREAMAYGTRSGRSTVSCPGSGPAETEAEKTAGCDASISASISAGSGYSGEPAASQTGFAHPVVDELARSVTVANWGMTASDYTQREVWGGTRTVEPECLPTRLRSSEVLRR